MQPPLAGLCCRMRIGVRTNLAIMAGSGALCPEGEPLKAAGLSLGRCSTPGCRSDTGNGLEQPKPRKRFPMSKLMDQACDMYVNDIARIDALGPNRRLIFTVPSVDEPGYENVVIKLILPAELLVKLAYMAVGADRETISPELIAHETRTAN
jgi:hypothetical protein